MELEIRDVEFEIRFLQIWICQIDCGMRIRKITTIDRK